MLYPQRMKEVMISRDGPFIQKGVLALWMVEPYLDGGVIARSPHGRIDIMLGPVITTEAHPALPELTPTIPLK